MENYLKENFDREPEPDMVMNDEVDVNAFNFEGQEQGVLLGAYYYQIIQLCCLIKPGDTVVDLGCGACNLLKRIAKLNPDANFFGVELSSNMIIAAKQNIEKEQIKNITLIKSDMTDVKDLKDGFADVVTSSLAIHQLSSISLFEKFFSEVARLTKQEKRLYLFDFGKFRRLETIDFLVSEAGNSPAKKDYKNSLKAAFKLADFTFFVDKYLNTSNKDIDIYSTKFMPYGVVIKSKSPYQLTEKQRKIITETLNNFNKQQRDDFQRIKLLLSLNGLKLPI